MWTLGAGGTWSDLGVSPPDAGPCEPARGTAPQPGGARVVCREARSYWEFSTNGGVRPV